MVFFPKALDFFRLSQMFDKSLKLWGYSGDFKNPEAGLDFHQDFCLF
jgi:hypothetical protein